MEAKVAEMPKFLDGVVYKARKVMSGVGVESIMNDKSIVDTSATQRLAVEFPQPKSKPEKQFNDTEHLHLSDIIEEDENTYDFDEQNQNLKTVRNSPKATKLIVIKSLVSGTEHDPDIVDCKFEGGNLVSPKMSSRKRNNKNNILKSLKDEKRNFQNMDFSATCLKSKLGNENHSSKNSNEKSSKKFDKPSRVEINNTSGTPVSTVIRTLRNRSVKVNLASNKCKRKHEEINYNDEVCQTLLDSQTPLSKVSKFNQANKYVYEKTQAKREELRAKNEKRLKENMERRKKAELERLKKYQQEEIRKAVAREKIDESLNKMKKAITKTPCKNNQLSKVISSPLYPGTPRPIFGRINTYTTNPSSTLNLISTPLTETGKWKSKKLLDTLKEVPECSGDSLTRVDKNLYLAKIQHAQKNHVSSPHTISKKIGTVSEENLDPGLPSPNLPSTIHQSNDNNKNALKTLKSNHVYVPVSPIKNHLVTKHNVLSNKVFEITQPPPPSQPHVCSKKGDTNIIKPTLHVKNTKATDVKLTNHSNHPYVPKEGPKETSDKNFSPLKTTDNKNNPTPNVFNFPNDNHPKTSHHSEIQVSAPQKSSCVISSTPFCTDAKRTTTGFPDAISKEGDCFKVKQIDFTSCSADSLENSLNFSPIIKMKNPPQSQKLLNISNNGSQRRDTFELGKLKYPLKFEDFPAIPIESFNSEYYITSYCTESEDEDEYYLTEKENDKPIPSWASKECIWESITKQIRNKSLNPDLIFGKIRDVDMSRVFANSKRNLKKRTSSAFWDTPMFPF